MIPVCTAVRTRGTYYVIRTLKATNAVCIQSYPGGPVSVGSPKLLRNKSGVLVMLCFSFPNPSSSAFQEPSPRGSSCGRAYRRGEQKMRRGGISFRVQALLDSDYFRRIHSSRIYRVQASILGFNEAYMSGRCKRWGLHHRCQPRKLASSSERRMLSIG